MYFQFIKIRTKQILRALYGLGVFRFLFLIALLSFIGFIIFKQSALSPNNYYILAFYIFTLVSIQIKRADKIFLETHFLNYKKIILIEYLILSTPFLFCFIFHVQYTSAFILLISILGIINMNLTIKKRSYNNKLQRWIPNLAFEWKAGFRQYLFLIVPLWIAAFGGSFFVGSIPIAIFIFGLIPLNFFEQGEPYQMIIAREESIAKFLLHKIKLQLIIFTALVAPLILMFLIFHVEFWYIPIIEYFIFFFLSIYFVLTKYAFYEPNVKSPAATTFGALGGVAALIPFFLPVIIFLSIWFYFKSTHKLKPYLHDFN